MTAVWAIFLPHFYSYKYAQHTIYMTHPHYLHPKSVGIA
eukprot:SAG11_NODE_14987_length_592_cov_1.050710_1_plen_38_part_01